jgi:hypothetical protein
MQAKKMIITAQLFISAMMALFMTGLFSALQDGLTVLWLEHWGQRFVVAWPIAFVASMVIGPLGFAMARRVLRVPAEQ